MTNENKFKNKNIIIYVIVPLLLIILCTSLTWHLVGLTNLYNGRTNFTFAVQERYNATHFKFITDAIYTENEYEFLELPQNITGYTKNLYSVNVYLTYYVVEIPITGQNITSLSYNEVGKDSFNFQVVSNVPVPKNVNAQITVIITGLILWTVVIGSITILTYGFFEGEQDKN